MKNQERQTKFVVEYTDENKKIVSKWHYDLDKFKNGPVLVEHFDLPRKETIKKKKT